MLIETMPTVIAVPDCTKIEEYVVAKIEEYSKNFTNLLDNNHCVISVSVSLPYDVYVKQGTLSIRQYSDYFDDYETVSFSDNVEHFKEKLDYIALSYVTAVLKHQIDGSPKIY